VFKEDGIEYLAERDSDGRLLRCQQPYPDSDAEAYKAKAEEIKVAMLPEPFGSGEHKSCQRKR